MSKFYPDLSATGDKLSEMSREELLKEAQYWIRLNDAIWDGEMDCGTAECGRMTGNTWCRDCMMGRSPAQRAERAESMLCALAFDEARQVIEVRHGEGCDRGHPDRGCIFCEANR